MKILAFDQASRISGYSVFEDGKLLEYGHWECVQSDFGKRIVTICEKVTNLIKKHNPDKVLFENIQKEDNLATFQKLAWVQGAMILSLNQLNVPYEIIYPSEWRSVLNFLKDNGKNRDTQKKIAKDWVFKTTGFKCTEDESDAICIGYSYFKKADSVIEFE